jgi:AcrR family transcriptional regulator
MAASADIEFDVSPSCWQRFVPVAKSRGLKRKGAGYHHGDLRRALVEATLNLVAAHGTAGFTLRAAAKLAGVTDGAPYHHFEDKEALLAAVAEESFELLCREMQSASERHGGDVRRRSRAMVVAYVLFAAKQPSRFRIMFGPVAESRDRHPGLAASAAKTHRLMRHALSRAVGGDLLAPKHVLVKAWALIHGLAVLTIDGHLGSTARTPKKLESLAWDALESLERMARSAGDAAPKSGRRARSRAVRTSRETA